jgi:hypothetical protein
MKTAYGKRDLENSLDAYATNSFRRNAKNDIAPSVRLYARNGELFNHPFRGNKIQGIQREHG